MTYDEIKAKWFAAKAGILNEQDLKLLHSEVFMGRTLLFYDCPCGGKDHLAARSVIQTDFSQEPSPILNCFETRQQWLVKPPNVKGIIRTEEEKYLKLLKLAPKIIAKILAKYGLSDNTLFLLKDTYGIDPEIVDMFINPKK